MKYVQSLKISRALLAQIEIILTLNDTPDTFVVSSYSNGREQGFSIFSTKITDPSEPPHSKPRRVSFAQCRIQNTIVIYFGLDADFDANNIPSESVYRNQQNFEFMNIVEAAKSIVRFLSFKEN